MEEEKIYYKDEHVKVTDLRITANHVTVPIDKIDRVAVDFKATTMTVAITVFLLSLIAVPAGCCFYGQYCWFGILLVIATFAYLINVYRTYTELKISTRLRTIKLIDASMRDREHIFKIAEALEIAFKEKWKKES
jgi:hypothetical protein